MFARIICIIARIAGAAIFTTRTSAARIRMYTYLQQRILPDCKLFSFRMTAGRVYLIENVKKSATAAATLRDCSGAIVELPKREIYNMQESCK